MPIKEDPSTFGDLHIKMKVKMPKTLSQSQIDQIKEVLGENDNEPEFINW